MSSPKRIKGKKTVKKTRPAGAQKPAQKSSSGFPIQKYPGIVIALLSFLLYVNTLSHQFAFDDAIVITGNSITQKGMAGIPDLVTKDFFVGIYGEQGMELTGGRYRPLSLVMFAIEMQLFGERRVNNSGAPVLSADREQLYSYDPFIGHLVNLIFYAISVYLLFVLLGKWFPKHPMIGWIGAVLFAIHPIHTEVVANIKSRDEIMALFFLVCSFLQIHKVVEYERLKHGVLAGVFFFLAAMSKENAFTFILFIPILMVVIYGKSWKKSFKGSLPIWISGIAYLLLRTSMVGLPSTVETNPSILENPFVDATPAIKFGTIFVVLLRYVILLFVPHTLSSDYSYPQIEYVGFGDIEALAGLLIYVGMGVMLIYGVMKRQTYALFLAAYLLPLSVASNIVFNIGAPMGERFVYMSSFGFTTGIAWILVTKLNIPTWKALEMKKGLLGALIVCGVFYSYRTVGRNVDWYNNETLFTADIENSPNSAKMNYYYANTHLKKQMSDESSPQGKEWLAIAEKHFTKAVELYPDFGLAWYNIGLVKVQKGEGKDALPFAKRALEIEPDNAKAMALMGQVYGRFLQQPKLGIAPLRKAIENYGNRDPGVVQNLAICYAMTQKTDSAAYYFEMALKNDPNNAKILQNLGGLMMQAGRQEKAQEYFSRAKTLQGTKGQ